MTFEPTSDPVPDLPTDRLPPVDDLPSDPAAPSFGVQAADDIATDEAAAPIGALNPAQVPAAFAPPPPLDAADSGLPLSPADAARDNARGGRWAMSEWYDGWIYLGVDGRPVVRNDGSRIGFRFADAPRLTQQLAAAPQEETADATDRRALAPLDSRFNKDWDPQRPKSTLADMTKWTRLLAYHLVQTTEPEEAVRRAVSMIFGNPVTMDARGEKLWVPTQYDAEAVKSLAGTLLRQAVEPGVVESDDQNPDAVEVVRAAEASPRTRTIRGVPLDGGRGLDAKFITAAMASDQVDPIELDMQLAQAAQNGRTGARTRTSSSPAFGAPSRQPGDSRYNKIIRNITPQPPSKRTTEIANALSNNPLTGTWRDWLAQRFETQGQPNDGYGTYQLDAKKKGDENKPEGFALGRYQMRRVALIDSGLMNRDGSPTGKYGIQNWQDFLNNPDAQEAALIEWTRVLEKSFRNNHTGRVGKTIVSANGPITVTQGGLIAAMHKQGTTGVIRYFKWLESMNWDSRNQNQMPNDLREGFVSIETRLREFEHIPY